MTVEKICLSHVTSEAIMVGKYVRCRTYARRIVLRGYEGFYRKRDHERERWLPDPGEEERARVI